MTNTEYKSVKKKLTLSINIGVLNAVKDTDINISEFVETELIRELTRRNIAITCPVCGQKVKV